MFKNCFIAENAVIEGSVSMGEYCSVWHGAVIRGDMAEIEIGSETNIQENCVLHVDHDFPLRLGNSVTCGHGAILHGCSVGDNTIVGMGAIILNGAKIGRNCIIGAGALVTCGTEIPDGAMVLGSPAKIKRMLSPDEQAKTKLNADEYEDLTKKPLP